MLPRKGNSRGVSLWDVKWYDITPVQMSQADTQGKHILTKLAVTGGTCFPCGEVVLLYKC